MQQLSGKTIDMIYQSCRSFHMEFNKIGFAFFWIFYNFLCILQYPAKRQALFKNPFTLRSLEGFNYSQLYHWFTEKSPERKMTLQLGPPGRTAGGNRRIRAVRWSWPTGNQRRVARGSPRLDSHAWSGRRWHQRACAADPGGGGRDSSKSGKRRDGGCVSSSRT
jgi:hypothetical protein